MTQSSMPWEGLLVGDAADAPYSSQEWSTYWARLVGAGSFPNYGYLQGTGDGSYPPLQVIATGAANVDVKTGAALVNGKMYYTDAAVSLTVSANASGNPRIDTVVLRADYIAQTIRPVIKQGVAAVSPARVALQQDASIWEIPLADIAVANGFSSITQADITDRRRAVHSSTAGWQPFVYPMSHILDATFTGNSSVFRFLLPIAVTGNMLVKQLVLRSSTTQASRNFKWGIYTQRANDQGANDHYLYFVGGWKGATAYQVNVANGQNFIVPAQSVFYLPPGHYWLAVENASVISMPYKQLSGFESLGRGMLVPGAAMEIEQTIDTAAASLSSTDDIVPARVDGVIFGEAP